MGFVSDAIEAVMDDRPDAAVEIAPGTFIRAAYVVHMMVPEAYRRAEAFVNQERLLRDVGLRPVA